MKNAREVRIPMPWELAGCDPKTPVLLALSGGADSRFLLDRLAKGAVRDGFPLLLAHVHHGIRGETADRDRDFCRALAGAYGLPIEILQVDVPALAKASGRGLEEEARTARYAFFGSLMRERKIPLLATAHQADDLLETMLFRIARGTGGGGLCAIQSARKIPEGWIVRPLLELTAAEIRRACRREGLDFVEDETNADSTYARNRIRKEAIPALEALYPAPQKQAVRLAERLGNDEDYFRTVVDRFFGEHPGPELSCPVLQELHPAIRSRVLARWLAGNAEVTADAAMIARMEDLIAGANGRSVPVNRKTSVVRRKNTLRVAEKSAPAAAYRVPLREGETALPGGVTVRVGIGQPTNVYNLSTENVLNFSATPAMMEQNLFWRGREPGDVILRGGHHRRLRRLWQAANVPEDLRDRLPVLCRGEDVVWAPFVGFADEKELC